MENRRKAGQGSEWKAIEMLYRVREAFETDVVTKFVRGHLLIPALRDAYDPVLVHIRRDPRAVMASFHRLGWTWYKNLSLEDQLLAPNDGRAEYFSKWEEMIRHYEQSKPLVRVAAYWALVERFVSDLPERARRIVISYEDLCLQPEEILTEKVANEIDGIHAKHFGAMSKTTEEGRVEISKWERVLDWKDVLTESIAEEIARVCKEASLEDALFQREKSIKEP